MLLISIISLLSSTVNVTMAVRSPGGVSSLLKSENWRVVEASAGQGPKRHTARARAKQPLTYFFNMLLIFIIPAHQRVAKKHQGARIEWDDKRIEEVCDGNTFQKVSEGHGRIIGKIAEGLGNYTENTRSVFIFTDRQEEVNNFLLIFQLFCIFSAPTLLIMNHAAGDRRQETNQQPYRGHKIISFNHEPLGVRS